MSSPSFERLKISPGLHRHALEVVSLGCEQIALEVDLADRVLRALVDRDRDVHVLLVGATARSAGLPTFTLT